MLLWILSWWGQKFMGLGDPKKFPEHWSPHKTMMIPQYHAPSTVFSSLSLSLSSSPLCFNMSILRLVRSTLFLWVISSTLFLQMAFSFSSSWIWPVSLLWVSPVRARSRCSWSSWCRKDSRSVCQRETTPAILLHN